MLGAIVVSLLMDDDVPTALAAVVGVLATAGVAVLLDLTLMRPVYRQKGEERTLLGLLLTLGAAFVIGGLLNWRYPLGALYINISGAPISILGVPMSLGSIWASVITLAVGAALLLFFGATTFGRGVRSVTRVAQPTYLQHGITVGIDTLADHAVVVRCVERPVPVVPLVRPFTLDAIEVVHVAARNHVRRAHLAAERGLLDCGPAGKSRARRGANLP